MSLPRGPENLCFDKDEFMKVRGGRGLWRGEGPPEEGGGGFPAGERGPEPWWGFYSSARALPPAGAARSAGAVTDRGSGIRPCPGRAGLRD